MNHSSTIILTAVSSCVSPPCNRLLSQAFFVPFINHHIQAYLRCLSSQHLAMHLGNPALSELTWHCCCSIQFSVRASSPPSSNRLSSRCCKAINAGRVWWAGYSELLRGVFLLLHFCPSQRISMLWPACDYLDWLPKCFWEILGRTHSCMHLTCGSSTWCALSLSLAQLCSSQRNKAAREGPYPSCLMTPAATHPSHAAPWQETHGLQAGIQNGCW